MIHYDVRLLFSRAADDLVQYVSEALLLCRHVYPITFTTADAPVIEALIGVHFPRRAPQTHFPYLVPVHPIARRRRGKHQGSDWSPPGLSASV